MAFKSLKPLANRVIVKKVVAETKTKSGIILTSANKGEQLNQGTIVAVDEEEGLVKVRNACIRIHVYLGQLCRSEIFDKNKDFKTNKDELLAKFGIGSKLPPEEQQYERDKYILKLVNGGYLDANNLVFHDDRVIILPKEDYLKQQEIK